MKYFMSFCLFLVIFLTLLGLVSLILTGPLFMVLGACIFVLSLYIFSNLHRLILMMLETREIIDTDYQELFQFVKSNTYSFGVKAPKVYSYKGTFKNFFILESFKEWIIVLDKDLIEQMDKEVLSDLISFLFNYHISGQGYLRTKIFGILISYHYVLLKVIKSLSPKGKESYVTRILSLFCLLLVRPITFVLEYLISRDKKVMAKEGLKPLYLQRKERDSSTVLLSHLGQDNLDPTRTIVEYAESFPLLNNCEFV